MYLIKKNLILLLILLLHLANLISMNEKDIKKGLNNNLIKDPNALLQAIKENDFNTLKYLINSKTDVNQLDKYQLTPLMHAIAQGHFLIARLLVEKKANVNAFSTTCGTPLHLAVQTMNKKLVKFLLDKGAISKKFKKKSPIKLAKYLHRKLIFPKSIRHLIAEYAQEYILTQTININENVSCLIPARNNLLVGTNNSYALAFSSHNKQAAISEDNIVKIYNVFTQAPIENIAAHTDIVVSLAYSNCHNHLASSSLDQTLKIWDTNTFKLLYSLKENYPILSLDYSPNGKDLAGGSLLVIKIWNFTPHKNNGKVINDYESLKTIIAHEDYVSKVIYSSDNKYLASASYDSTIKLWDVQPSKGNKYACYNFLLIIRGHPLSISSISFSYNNLYLASSCEDNIIKIWDINFLLKSHSNFQPLFTLEGHTNSINSIAYYNDKDFLASGSADNTIKIWRLNEKDIYDMLYNIIIQTNKHR